MNTVPCNGCRRCCIDGNESRLLGADEEAKFEKKPHPTMPGHWKLAQKPNGECYYLGETGCVIQDDKPKMCQEFDCRTIGMLPYSFIRRRGPQVISVWRKGKDLLKLTPPSATPRRA